jgi:hypothetical protein
MRKPNLLFRLLSTLGSLGSAWTATAGYSAITIAMTWPLARGLTRDIPSDLGDPLLNCWILGWVADHLLRLAGGDLRALDGFWNGNIFHPEPLALGYSEHLFAQAVQILPVYALTGNLILCYNLLFLSTFVLSGLGVYLLVREVTGSPWAAFLAGLAFAFTPYRSAQMPHLHILSGQWMPFALFGIRRYFVTRRVLPLAGAVVALVAQNLSCGYYLLYFLPFAAAYALAEAMDRGLVRTGRVWLELAAAGTAVVAMTWPFLTPYRELRALGHPSRPLSEVEYYSADVFSYLSAPDILRLWGGVVRAFPKQEGELFPSFVAIILALAGGAVVAGRAWHASGAIRASLPLTRRLASAAILAVWVAYAAAGLVILTGAGGTLRLGPFSGTITNFYRPLIIVPLSGLILVVLDPRARAFVRGVRGSPYGFFIVAAIVAAWCSLGPVMRTKGLELGYGPYWLLHHFVPGFDGLRVPARFGVLVMLFLAIIGGAAGSALERHWRRGRVVIGLIAILLLIETTAAPIPVNTNSAEEGLQSTSSRVFTGEQVPKVYEWVRSLPTRAVLVELPFGAPGYEIRYVYYSTTHWRPLLNGYSGGTPPGYQARRVALGRMADDPDAAWRAVVEAGATHAILHEDAYLGGDAGPVRKWLLRYGARPLARFGPDEAFELQP